MRPVSLCMQAFGSYGAFTRIDFNKPVQNLFLITGDTGAGKTTIFDAIVFALYGEASSLMNKKEGVVLQSQFARQDTEPFVELVFRDGSGSARAEYTVRRVPRHLRLLKRGSAKGTAKETVGSVTLTMPDGTVYPQKETDAKIQEIVGLTKSQFMQIAMIAQGEFMTLLRSKSDEKKVIFRRLFGTQLYEQVGTELSRRRQEQGKALDEMKTACMLLAGRLKLDAEDEQTASAEDVRALQKHLTDGEMIFLVPFLDSLAAWITRKKARQARAAETYEKAQHERDERTGELAQASSLLSLFRQLEEAEKDLQQGLLRQEAVTEMERQIGSLEAAMRILPAFRETAAAVSRLEDTRVKLRGLEEKIPGYGHRTREMEKQERKCRQELDEALTNLSRVEAQVKSDKKHYSQIQEYEREEKELQKRQTNAAQRSEQLMESVRKQEEELVSLQERAAALEAAPGRLGEWKASRDHLDRLQKECDRVRRLRSDAEKKEAGAEKAKRAYERAKAVYTEADGIYQAARSAFLDAQAGLLARDLKEGSPCPVCGSTVHPMPCRIAADAPDLTREKVENLKQAADAAARVQEKAVASAQSEAAAAASALTFCEEALEALRGQVEAAGGPQGQADEAGASEEAIGEWLRTRLLEADAEGAALRKEVKEREEILERLAAVQKRLPEMRAEAGEAAEKAVEIAGKLQKVSGEKAGLQKQLFYPTMDEAEAELGRARERNLQKDALHKEAVRELDKARETENQAKALADRYMAEIPGMEGTAARSRAMYEEYMQRENLTESEWLAIVRGTVKDGESSPGASAQLESVISGLRKQAQEYHQAMAAAKERRKSLAEAVKGKERPDIEACRAKAEEAGQALQRAKEALDRAAGSVTTAEEVLKELRPLSEKREKAAAAYARIDALCRAVTGNITGSRMDLETFVQRSYLRHILAGANRRFSDMTGGQFEMRMVDETRAGEGKNRGLDLTVYCALTGKEREIRTLSGGESFMAALSLALGMADQIRAGSSAVSLDIMFIDEGFGSLDDQARRQAVKVLLEMAGGDRLIGIISHVTELKQEIEDKLVVTRDERGSHVRWVQD